MEYWPDGDILTPGLLYDIADFAPNNNRAYARISSADTVHFSALPTTPCLGSFFIRRSDGTDQWFAGSASKIYTNNPPGWTDVSGATYTATVWDGCAFGTNVIAANGASKLQAKTSGGVFGDITDSPTGAWIVYVHKNALIALGSSTDGAAWARSKTADYTTWTAAASNDADSGSLYGGIGGKIIAGCAYGNLAIAWKKNAMYGGLYVGNADPNQDVIKWDIISDDPAHGCCAQWAFTKTNAGLFFASPLDICVFQGNSPVSIADKIRKAWLAEAYANNSKIWLSHDAINSHIYVWVRPSGQTANTRAWIYNYKTDQWGRMVSFNDMRSPPGGSPLVPVRNASYEALTTIYGIATNSRQICHLFFDDTGLPANLCGQTLTSNGYLRTGWKGKPDTDSFLHRVYCVSDSFSGLPTTAGNIPTLDTTAANQGKVTSTLKTTYIANGGWWDVGIQGAWFYSKATFPSGAGMVSVQKLLHELRTIPRQGPSTPTQVLE